MNTLPDFKEAIKITSVYVSHVANNRRHDMCFERAKRKFSMMDNNIYAVNVQKNKFKRYIIEI